MDLTLDTQHSYVTPAAKRFIYIIIFCTDSQKKAAKKSHLQTPGDTGRSP